nr:unnamed protein product [Digitaria exilis]
MVARRGGGAQRGGGIGGAVGEDAASRLCMGGAAVKSATARGGVSFGSCGQRHGSSTGTRTSYFSFPSIRSSASSDISFARSAGVRRLSTPSVTWLVYKGAFLLGIAC